jgi:hypothetical protein
MKIVITPSLLVVVDYDGDELAVALRPDEYQKLVEIEAHVPRPEEPGVFTTSGIGWYTKQDFYKYVNLVIRTAWKDTRRTLNR